MLNYEFPPIGGGAGNANLCLLKELSGIEGLEIDVLTSAPEPGFDSYQFTDNISIYKVGIHKKNLHYWRKTEVLEWLFKSRSVYRALINATDYDVVHSFFGFPTAFLCYRDFAKTPYIVSLRGSDVPGYNVRLGLDYMLLSGLFKKIWRNASAVVANSKGLARLANKFMPEIDIEIISNGVYTDKFLPSDAERSFDPVRLLTVCRLISRKRIDMLIEATAKLKNAGVNVTLSIAGEGNLSGELKSLAGSLGVGDEVNFLGRVDAEDMPGVYRDNDIFVMSSAHEGMSNAMLEAIASGLAIVTTRCEGVEELIQDNGIVVETADAEAIGTAVTEMINDPGKYSEFSTAARKRAEQFTWANMADEYVKCYKRVINRK